MIPLRKTIIFTFIQPHRVKTNEIQKKNVDKSILIFHSSYSMKYSFAPAKIINPEEISFKRKGTILKGRYSQVYYSLPCKKPIRGEFIVLKGSRIANRNKNRVFN